MNALLKIPPLPDTNTIPSNDLQPIPPDQRLINRRQIWAANRFWMEMNNIKTKRYGNKGYHHWYALLLMMKAFELILHVIGKYEQGANNAKSIILKNNSLYFPNLLDAFDGFTILHLSDLHLDGISGIEDIILEKIDNKTVDLCVLTGDYRTQLHGLNKHVINKLKYLVSNIRSHQGFIGILGNHDDCHMVNPLEKIGICMLINGSCIVKQRDDQIRIIGTDDVHYYYTDQALHAMEYAEDGFSIALVHSCELYDTASQMGVNLYLCGHSHAGQICLPGGIPILTHLNRGRRYYCGNWCYQGMQGFTHGGVGTSGIPVRFNTRGEIVIHTLFRQHATHLEH